VSIARPDATSFVAIAFVAAFGLFIAACLGIAVIAMLHTYIKASAEKRSADGLTLLLVATLVGLGPSFLVVTLAAIAPQVVLPGAQFSFLTMVMIPASFAWAAMKGGRTSMRTV
jgi:flagellar biosynthesis protein FlhB